MIVTKSYKSFGGKTEFYKHDSKTTKTPMQFSMFTPENAEDTRGAIFWLSGLTCTEENFMAKAGAQKLASQFNVALICPDTSPRGLDLKEEHSNWDFGSGASFYVNAKTDGYKSHYKMYDYITEELYGIVTKKLPVKGRVSIMGHSMGGHGALVMGLREHKKFASISAFSPIVNPMQCPWGQKAFMGYLGDNEKAWAKYDACELIKSGKARSGKILIDQGTADEFLKKELLTDNFAGACMEHGQKLELNYREGYDHSYYFIASFIENHIEFHARRFQ